MAEEAPECVKWQGLLSTLHHSSDENTKLAVENEELKAEVARLKQQNWVQAEKIAVLSDANPEIARLENENIDLREENMSVPRHRNDMRDFFETERARLAEAERIRVDKLQQYIAGLANEIHMAWMGYRVDRGSWANIKVRLDASLRQIGSLEAELGDLQEKVGLLIVDHTDLRA